MPGLAQKNIKIKNSNVTLNVKVYSEEKSSTIILLHGGPGVPDDMTEIADALKAKFRVITFEQRGLGQSECLKCDYTMEAYISDIDAIADFFKLDKFHLFGHSWGGVYAQIYAMEKPEKLASLFLCSPGSGTNTTWKKTEKEVMRFNKSHSTSGEWLKMGWNSFMGMMGSNKAYRKLFKQVLQNYHKNYDVEFSDIQQLEAVNARPINKTRKQILKYKPLGKFSNVPFPVQITYGDHDIYGTSSREVIERFPMAKVDTIKNSGHIPWKHNILLFKTLLNDFYLKETNSTSN